MNRPMNRRDAMQSIASLTLGASATLQSAENKSKRLGTLRMPDEAEPHRATWMAFGASEQIWGKHLLVRVQQDLALIARTISKYEPVKMLVRSTDMDLARKLTQGKVQLIEAQLDDIWIRDSGAVFVHRDSGHSLGWGFNFNAWGNKQAHKLDATVAGQMCQLAQIDFKKNLLTLEGGGIEVDGHGSAIITESCVLNPNRNPGLSKTQVEKHLFEALGLQKIIWLPGIAGKDITDGHTDFYARFSSPGVVVAAYDPDPKSFDHAVCKQHLGILRSSTDAQGRNLKVHVMQAPEKTRSTYANNDFAAGYINFYVCNGAVIAPEFGDPKADAAAKNTLQRLFPGRSIEQLNIDSVAAGGGGIHCVTQQEPVFN